MCYTLVDLPIHSLPSPPPSNPSLLQFSPSPLPHLFRCIWINFVFNYLAIVLFICVYVVFFGVCGALPHGCVRVGGHSGFLRRGDENQQLLGKCVFTCFILSALITCIVIPHAPFTLCPSPFNPSSPSILHPTSFYSGVHE